MHSRWPRLDGLAYGGDYNPEQWPEEVWEEDVALMREAGVKLVSVGIFSWGMLEPAAGRVRVRLAGPGARPAARRRHRGRPGHADGRAAALVPAPAPGGPAGHPRRAACSGGGSRQSLLPVKPRVRERGRRGITRQLAERYGAHPAVVMWHVNNEYGATVGGVLLRDLGGGVPRLAARPLRRPGRRSTTRWGTAFWAQRYGALGRDRRAADVGRPRSTRHSGWTSPGSAPTRCSPASAASGTSCTRSRPGIPVTTNFMATNCKSVDYWQWAREVDVVSNDHYLIAEATDSHLDLAMSADLTRSLAGGGPWLLMEHSTSAVNWQPRNIAKRPGEMRRNCLAHVARGADGVLFFQWRASRFGAEKFHSAMLPQGGTGTRVWREVVELGADLAGLAGLRGTVAEPDVACSGTGSPGGRRSWNGGPSVDLGYRERIEAYYEASCARHADRRLRPPRGRPAAATAWSSRPRCTCTTTPAADEPAPLRRGRRHPRRVLLLRHRRRQRPGLPGPLPGALRDVLGLTVEEFLPLRAGRPGRPSPGMNPVSRSLAADVWTEAVILAGAKPVAWYAERPGGRAAPPSPATTWAKAAPGMFPPAPTPRPRRRCSPPPAPRPASTRLPPRCNRAPGRATWRSSVAPTGSAASSCSSTTGIPRRPFGWPAAS